jgi:hypothetical protein
MYGKFLSIGSAVQRAQMTTDCLHPEAAQICVSHKSHFYRCDWPISGLISGRAARGNSARQRQRQRPRFFFPRRCSWAVSIGRRHTVSPDAMRCSKVRQSPEALQSVAVIQSWTPPGRNQPLCGRASMRCAMPLPPREAATHCCLLKACIIFASNAAHTTAFSRTRCQVIAC